MKTLSIKKLLWSNLTIKCCSLILGFGIWSFLSQAQKCSFSCLAPIWFMHKDTRAISGPPYIEVTLAAQRSHLSTLDMNAIAVHIDAQNLKEGKNTKIVSQEDLLLPSYINMVDCNPRIVELIVESCKEAS